MILYNVTSALDAAIADEWLTFMRDIHMPEVVATGCFIKSQLLRLLDEEEGGCTYAAQYYAIGIEQLEAYQEHFAPALRADMDRRFGGRFAAFRTVLEIVA